MVGVPAERLQRPGPLGHRPSGLPHRLRYRHPHGGREPGGARAAVLLRSGGKATETDPKVPEAAASTAPWRGLLMMG